MYPFGFGYGGFGGPFLGGFLGSFVGSAFRPYPVYRRPVTSEITGNIIVKNNQYFRPKIADRMNLKD